MKNLISLFKLLKRKYILSKYDNYSIAEYFRNQGAQIGKDCHLGITKLSTEPYLVKIGNKVLIAKGVILSTHTSGWNFRDEIPDIGLFGKIVIEDNCYIGVNAIILPNVTIGRNSIVSAGAVVTRDIPPNSIAAGVPARVIGDINTFREKMIKQWQVLKPEGYMDEIEKGKTYTRKQINMINQLPKNQKLLRKHLTRHFWGTEM